MTEPPPSFSASLSVRLALSCGLAALRGDPVTPEAVQAAQTLGADISAHTAVPVEEVLVAEAAYIYGMTGRHAETLRRLFPEHAARIDTLDEIDIDDPFCRGEAVYRAVAGQIAAAVERLVERLALEKDEI